MKDAFKTHFIANFPQLLSAKILLTISGGLDSVVLAYLCKAAGLDFALAHCNFTLRGKESDADADFITELANEMEVECFIQEFDTKTFAEDNKLSTQMAARELRYTWFEELRMALQYDYILTAHHAQDDLETFLINLGRGAGLDGLTGIPAENDKIIRPLLDFSRKQIAAYAAAQDIKWREDSSNASDYYLRNHIRHHVIPALEETTPHFLQNFKKSQHYLQESQNLVSDYISLLVDKLIKPNANGYQIDLIELQKLSNQEAILYQLLKDFGFTNWSDVYALVQAQSGKIITSATHRLIKNRDYLLISELNEGSFESYEISLSDNLLTTLDLQLSWEEVTNLSIVSKTEALFDSTQLTFPLTLRKWQEGDFFFPYGMKGKKKVSKFFKDEKFSVLDKEATWLLCNGKDIIWIIGHRTDERYKVDTKSRTLLKFKVVYDT